MKKSTIILTVLIAMSIGTNAQWTQQSSGTQKNLWGVCFLDSNIGYVCGDSGTILKTNNGGTTWVLQTSGNKYQLSNIMFVDANTGYCTSFTEAGGKLLKTINGGTTWSDISLNVSDSHCGGGKFFSSDTGLLALGTGSYDQSKILKTVNGGVSWDTVYNGGTGTGWISFIYFADRKNGYATVSGSGILKTTDGGDTWTLLNNIGGNLWMSGVYFFTKDYGFVGGGNYSTGGGSIFKTTDGGISWQTVSTSYGTSVMQFISSESGFAIGNSVGWSVKKIIKSTDAGSTWINDPTPSIKSLNGIMFPNANIGYAVGDTGIILKYDKTLSIVNETFPDNMVTLYPNPASGLVTLNIDKNINEEFTVTIYNEIGSMVKSETFKHYNNVFSTADLNNGVYIVTIKSKAFTKTQRLIIQK